MAQKLFYLVTVTTIIAVWLAQGELSTASVQTESTSGTSTLAASLYKKETLALFFGGDVMPSRWVAKRMHEHGYDYPFTYVKPLIKSADIAFVNLESPILPGREIQGGEMIFRTDPEFAPAMKGAGIDIVSLANNHTPNFGEDGLQKTFAHLRNADIAFVGAGTTSRAYAPVYVDSDGFIVAYIAQNETDVVPENYCATAVRLGTACFNKELLTSSILEAKRTADYVVFTMHAGDEYTRLPNERQRAFAHHAIDAGADIVIGHHPHVIQSTETYREKPIYYSLGNFIFDQDWSEETRTGLTLTVLLDRASRKIIDIRETTVDIVDYAKPVPKS